MNSSLTPIFQSLNAFGEYNGKRVYCKINKYMDEDNNSIKSFWYINKTGFCQINKNKIVTNCFILFDY